MKLQAPGRLGPLLARTSPLAWSLEKWAAACGVASVPVLAVGAMLSLVGLSIPPSAAVFLGGAFVVVVASVVIVVLVWWVLLIPIGWLAWLVAYKVLSRSETRVQG